MKTTIFGNLSKTYKNEGKVEGEILDKIKAHLSTTTGNPHKVTAGDVGSYTKEEVDSKIDVISSEVGNRYTKDEVDKKFEEVGGSVDAYTKAETDDLLSDKADAAELAKVKFDILGLPTFNDVYTKEETDNAIKAGCEELAEQFGGIIDEIGYFIEEQFYHKSEIDGMIGDIDSALDELHNYAQALIGGEA